MYLSVHNPATRPCPVGVRRIVIPLPLAGRPKRKGMGNMGADTAAAVAAQNAFVAALNAGTATPALAIAAGYNPNVISNGKWNPTAVSQMVAGLSPGQPGYNEALQAASDLAAVNAQISTQPVFSASALPTVQAGYQSMLVPAPPPAASSPAALPPAASPAAPAAPSAPATGSTSTNAGSGATPVAGQIGEGTASSGCLAFFAGETCIGPVGATTLLVGGLGILALAWLFGGKRR